MRSLSKSKKRIAVVGVSVAMTAALSGVAFAYFDSTGQGTGSALTGTNTTWAVSAPADSSGDLVPNTTIGTGVIDTINYTVTNNSAGNQELNQVVISIGTSSGTSPSALEGNWTAGSSPTCNSSDFSVGGQAVGDGVTAGSGSFTQTLGGAANDMAPNAVYHGSVTLQMIDNGASQDSCKSASVPLFISAS